MGEKIQKKDVKKAPAEIKQATPLQLKGKTSKNQRVGEKQKQKVKVCPKGHPVTVALFVPVKGKTRIIYICNCNSAGPENDGRVKATGGDAWMQRKDSGILGKKRDAVKSKGSTNAYLHG